MTAPKEMLKKTITAIAEGILRELEVEYEQKQEARGGENTMNVCRECRHWRHDKWDEKGWGGCVRGGSRDGKSCDTKTLVYAADCEGYSATLNTHENFGCIQFEESAIVEYLDRIATKSFIKR